MFQWRAGKALTWQVCGLLLVWAYVSGLHLRNDGLWPHGDAARHAANGLFFWDFLTALPVHPVEFALRYYARYPVIQPTAYPPMFYLLEGAAFAVFGISPYVAKSLVLLFALVGCGYALAWLRRWVAEEAGWGGLLLMVQPAVIQLSHAIMLNIPAMTLSLATLYYTRRWLEAPASRYLYLAVCGALVAPLTYAPAGMTLCVMLAWILAERRWIVLRDRRVWILLAVVVLCLLPWVVIGLRWAPMHTRLAFPSTVIFVRPFEHLDYWLYYCQWLSTLFSTSLLGTALLGMVMGWLDRQWRHEVKLVLIWGGVCFLVLSYLMVRAPRYALFVAPPAVLLGSGGLFCCSRWWEARLGIPPSRVFLSAIAVLLLLHIASAHLVQVPAVKGFREVIAFVEREVPHGFIFYDGRHDGIFSFYMRAGDPHFARGVVLGDKLLYTSAVLSEWGLTERVASEAEVLETLRTRCGCQWLVIARSNAPPPTAAVHYLYEVLKGPEFQLVRTFLIEESLLTHVAVHRLEVYRFLSSALAPAERELPFLSMGPGTVLRAKPLER